MDDKTPTDGEVLLPAEPTEEMLNAAVGCVDAWRVENTERASYAAIYRAMVAACARPAPQAAEAVAQYESLGYALAARVTQSDLYKQLDARERAECDVLLNSGLYATPQWVRNAWVSVKDRLPECGGKYWCVVRFKARYNGAICTRPAHRKYRALDFDVEKQGFWLDNGMPQEMITHWMKAEKMPPHESAPPAMSEGGGE